MIVDGTRCGTRHRQMCPSTIDDRQRALRREFIAFGIILLVALPSAGSSQSATSTCGAAVQELLATFEGRWRVETIFRAGEAAWDSTTDLATITSELSGCLLREEYRGIRFGHEYSYLAIWGANGQDPTPYQRAFAHSQHGLLILRQGSFVADTLVLRSTTHVRGQDVLEEDRIARPRSSTFMFTNRRSTDGGTTWITTRRSRYVRLQGAGG